MINETWKNLMGKWNDYKNKNIGFFSIGVKISKLDLLFLKDLKKNLKDKNAAFSFYELYFNSAVKGIKNTEENNQSVIIFLIASEIINIII